MSQDAFCHTCNKSFKPSNIKNHLKMHQKKGERCEVTYAGATYDQPANNGKQSGVKRPGLGGKK